MRQRQRHLAAYVIFPVPNWRIVQIVILLANGNAEGTPDRKRNRQIRESLERLLIIEHLVDPEMPSDRVFVRLQAVRICKPAKYELLFKT